APDPCWLLLRSLKTLRVRMERITATAQTLVEKLRAHPAIETVRYAGFSGLLSFDVPNPGKVETSLRLIKNATSLGGTESVLESRARWEGDRVPPGLLRLSVGLEEAPGQFWKDFVRDTAPEFRKPTIDQLETFILPVWQELVDGARYVDDRLGEIIGELEPDVIVQDNVVGFPAVLASGRPWVRI